MASEWTIETLKEYVDMRFDNIEKIADLKITQNQNALDIKAANDAAHFEQLNENAKRTIEERSHFVSREAFDPFRERVNTKLDQSEGKNSGLSQGWGILIGLVGLAGGVITIIYFFTR